MRGLPDCRENGVPGLGAVAQRPCLVAHDQRRFGDRLRDREGVALPCFGLQPGEHRFFDNMQSTDFSRIRKMFILGRPPTPLGEEERPASAVHRAGKRRRWRALALLSLAFLKTAAAAEVPSPPCGGPPQPSYAAPGEPEHSGTWTRSDLGDSWAPPSCTGWTGTDFRIIAALAAGFRDPASADQLLARFGAISSQIGLRYWSATEHRWRELITAGSAVEGPAGKQPRADFSAAELRSGQDLYYSQSDNRSAGQVVYRMRALEVRPDRIVIAVENVTSIRLLLFTLFPPGSIQSLHFLERQPDGGWGYYSLMRTRADSSILTGGFASSYVNRAVAFYRHIAGILPDAVPAAAR